ncbi:GNAT family N-acetyltransferase [Fusobacterium mortiferum]|uniref:GNAT family N-acetyltransferase n=1 Tax=Fusobacterium mortiferum TaxID=850 RepID=UPI00164D1E0F|nr:GNAT family N-acetyltransferase [Fusobacterium mortiferum]
MEFTYLAYEKLIKQLKDKGYKFCDYTNYIGENKAVILRHDVDTSLNKALEMAKLEKKLGISAYYFVLLSTDFYNINSEKSLKILKEIRKLGGRIGLHFDEKKYNLKSKEDYIKYVNYELDILSRVLEEKIDVVSMHRPSKDFLEMDLEIPNVINSYQKKFFNDFKYVSDSRMSWRENVEEIVDSEKYSQLHILTHPFWYSEKIESMEEKLEQFLKLAIKERYESLEDNIRDFENIQTCKEVLLNLEIEKFYKNNFITQRLILRKINLNDLDDLFEINSNPSTCKYLNWEAHKTKKETLNFFNRVFESYNKKNDIFLGIRLKDNKKLIGMLRIYKINLKEKSAEISYIQNENYCNKGYMKEALNCVISSSFKTLKLNHIYMEVMFENIASEKVMLNLGMKLVESEIYYFIKNEKKRYKRYRKDK